MRYLFWTAAGFAVSCGFYAWGLPFVWIPLAAAVLAVLVQAVRKKRYRLPLTLLAGLLAGILSCRLFDASVMERIRVLDGQTMELTVTVCSEVRETSGGQSVDGRVSVGGRAYSARIYLRGREAVPGDTLRGAFRVSCVERGSAFLGKGIFLILSQTGKAESVPGGKANLRVWGEALREKTKAMICRVIPESGQPLARGLFLGDTSQLDYPLETALRVSGIRHAVAVSGMHLSILFSLIFLFAGKRRLLTVLLCLPVLVSFAAMVGFNIPVSRALIMMLLFLLALLIGREYDGLTALGVAVMLILWDNPYRITAVGFQLSVGGVLGILLFSRGILRKLRGFFSGRDPGRVMSFALAAVATAVGALVFTTPISAYHFGCVSLIGVVTNLLLTLPISLAFYSIFTACIAGWVFLPLGKALGFLTGGLLALIRNMAQVLARLPFAAVYTQSPYIVLWLVAAYLLLGIWFAVGRKRGAAFAAAAVVLLWAAVVASWWVPAAAEYEALVLDVGQGQCILLQSGSRAFLVDCGGDYGDSTADLAAETLLSRGIQRIDGVILSHPDRDHCGGAAYFLTRVQADAVFLPNNDGAAALAEELKETGGTASIFLAEEDFLLETESCKLTVFVPQNAASSNESSLCVLFQTENCDILITGDLTAEGERALLRRTELPHLTALVVGHHGASTSTCDALLQATTPETAVISVGKNSYGHPREDVLERLETWGCRVMRTDQNGTIRLRR